MNIGSEEMVSINQLAQLAIDISGKELSISNLEGEDFRKKYGFECPLGVRGRNSENSLFRERVGGELQQSLKEGMKATYPWIEQQVKSSNTK